MNSILDLSIGLGVGLIVGSILTFLISKYSKKQTDGQMEQLFSSLSQKALKESNEQFLQLAATKLEEQLKRGEQNLEGKKGLIDKTLTEMRQDLNKVENTMQEFQKDRAKQFGQLGTRLDEAAKVVGELRDTTNGLRTALSSTKKRGEWGERMAEDVLRLAGMVENINYIKQKKLETESGKPDFTFLLPKEMKVHMDVKFPFDNYERYINAESETDKKMYQKKFLGDVRGRIKELNSRAYINPEEQTVDYVLLFIPNEQIYSFIQEVDRSIVEDALKTKIILCSPLTLYAVLGLIRQAMDNFAIESKSKDMLSLLGKFKEQWTKFKDTMTHFGDKLNNLQKAYDTDLLGTRLRQLEKPLDKLDNLRIDRGLPVADIAEDTFAHIASDNVEKNMQTPSSTSVG